jgi:amino acid permease
MIFVAFMTFVSVHLLLLSHRACRLTSYSAIAYETYGVVGSTIVKLAIITNNFGTLTLYIITFARMLSSIVPEVNYYFFVLIFYGLMFFVNLSREMSVLKYLSSLAITSVLTFAVIMIITTF